MNKNLILSIVVIIAVWLFVNYDFDTYIMPATAILPDGGRYYGELKDNQFSGEGKIVWASGASYHGTFKDGLFSGLGQLEKSYGYTFEGQFVEGEMTGQGTLTTKNGSIYKGQFKSFNFDGYGRLQFDQGSSYVGDFKEGNYQGSGTLIIKDGESYTGDFENNQYHGVGHVKYKDGASYRGHFDQGEFHGKGIYKGNNGDSFEGEFVKSKFTGQGVFEDSSENRYEGGFKDWVYEGKGKWTGVDGREYEGLFVEGKLTGEGVYKNKKGLLYRGQFKDWMYHGKGDLYKVNGDHYQGDFQYGSYDGKGGLTYATPKHGETGLTGQWLYGKYKGDGNEPDSAEFITEKVLYNQNHLIQETLASLLPSDNDKINMYFLGIGGDGKQDVFYKEVTTIRSLFDQSFATLNRSAVLINNAKTVDSIAMATNTAIEQVMQGMSKKMDVQNDILFVYLTSHGSKDHEFQLDQDGLDLNDLSAKSLAKIIKKLPVKWKVVVISACYAGGFIPELKNDNTMIITAAAHDRSSFGCSDDADMTYFGRAFFLDALAESGSFEATFEKAKELVKQREKEHIAAEGGKGKHSNPQISSSKAISKYLKKWWQQFEPLPATIAKASMTQ